MKKTLSFLISAALLAGCEKNEVPVYDGPSSVYFDVFRLFAVDTYYLSDSSVVSFAFTPQTTDSTIMLRIRTQGDTSGHARPVAFRIIDTAGNAAGPHQFSIPSKLEVPAGKNFVNLPITLKKTADMQTQAVSLTLELLENEPFKTPVSSSFVPETGRDVNVTRHTVVFSDILSKPKYWFDPYLGAFSRKKWLLVCELLDIPVNALEDGSTSVGTLRFYGRYTRNYLEAEAAAGRTVLEEDGSVMKMGDAL